MQLYEHALWGAVAHIDASQEEVDFPQWKSYSDSLQIHRTYPGINGLGIILNVKLEDKKGLYQPTTRACAPISLFTQAITSKNFGQ